MEAGANGRATARPHLGVGDHDVCVKVERDEVRYELDKLPLERVAHVVAVDVLHVFCVPMIRHHAKHATRRRYQLLDRQGCRPKRKQGGPASRVELQVEVLKREQRRIRDLVDTQRFERHSRGVHHQCLRTQGRDSMARRQHAMGQVLARSFLAEGGAHDRSKACGRFGGRWCLRGTGSTAACPVAQGWLVP